MNPIDLFSLFLKGLIVGLLILGSYTDLRTRLVSNKITFSIMLLVIPLIYWNADLRTYFPMYLISLGGLLFAYLFLMNTKSMIGGADVKAIVPLMLSLSAISFMLFFFLTSVAIMLMWFKWKQGMPGFIAITVGYIVASITITAAN